MVRKHSTYSQDDKMLGCVCYLHARVPTSQEIQHVLEERGPTPRLFLYGDESNLWSEEKEAELSKALASDPPLLCTSTLRAVRHCLGPKQRVFFDATENSVLFRQLLAPDFPAFFFQGAKGAQSGLLETVAALEFDGDRRAYVVKPSVGYASLHTFKLCAREDLQRELAHVPAEVREDGELEWIVEEYLEGAFVCGDCVVEVPAREGGGEKPLVVVAGVYERFDYGIQETAAACSAALWREHAPRFEVLCREILVKRLPFPPGQRVLINIEAKVDGATGKLQLVEINPFRWCGVAPAIVGAMRGDNLFREVAFADDPAGGAALSDHELAAKAVVSAYARKQGESAEGIASGVACARGRKLRKVRQLMREEDVQWCGIHDGAIFAVEEE